MSNVKSSDNEESIERRNYKAMIRLSLASRLEADPKILDYISDLLTTLVLLMKYLPSDVGTAIFASITNALPEDKQFEFIVNWMSKMIEKYYRLQSIIGRFAPPSSGGGDIMTQMFRLLMEEKNRQSMMTQSSNSNQQNVKVKIERNEELEKLLFGDEGNGEQKQ
jgi:hypothetical protein